VTHAFEHQRRDEVVYAPEIAVSGVRVDEIAGFMEDLT